MSYNFRFSFPHFSGSIQITFPESTPGNPTRKTHQKTSPENLTRKPHQQNLSAGPFRVGISAGAALSGWGSVVVLPGWGFSGGGAFRLVGVRSGGAFQVATSMAISAGAFRVGFPGGV